MGELRELHVVHYSHPDAIGIVVPLEIIKQNQRWRERESKISEQPCKKVQILHRVPEGIPCTDSWSKSAR